MAFLVIHGSSVRDLVATMSFMQAGSSVPESFHYVVFVTAQRLGYEVKFPEIWLETQDWSKKLSRECENDIGFQYYAQNLRS